MLHGEAIQSVYGSHYYMECRSTVFVDNHSNTKIGDFGFTRKMFSKTVSLKCMAKTMGYNAPEVDS